MACVVPDGTTRTVAVVARSVSFVALVSNGRTRRLTPGVPCQYDPAWGNGALRDVLGAGVHKRPATPAVGPAQGLTSAQRLGLVGGGDYSCERVAGAYAETCRGNGLP
jgi:hypothetical protein